MPPSNNNYQNIINEGTTSIKDIVAPSAVALEYNYIQLGSYFLRTFFVYAYPRILYTDWLSPIINVNFSMNTSLFIYPVETQETLKKLRNKAAQIESSVVENRQKGKVRDPLLDTAMGDVDELRDTLQRGEAKLFKTSLYFTIFAKSKDELETLSLTLQNLLGSSLVLTKPAIFQMEQGLNSALPYEKDDLMVAKNLDTGALSTFFPFASSDLSRNEGILYGINKHTNGLVLFDRFNLENANSVILAKSGAGKSYAVKLELLRYLITGTEVIVIDPENEYERLCSAVGGSFLNININSDHRINPFDLPIPDPNDPADAENNLRSNIILLHGLIRIMARGKITAIEDNLLDQALVQAYASKGITKDPATHNLEAPTMDDLIKTLASIRGAENIVASLTKFSEGTFAGIFNQKTNINLDNRFVVFSIRDLEDELRPMAMYMILNYIWNRVKGSRKRRILAVDEAWIMMKYQDSAKFLFSLSKRARKYYLGISTIVQDVEDFLSSNYGKAIIHNSSMSLLLKQHPAAVDMVVEVFNLTSAEKYFLLNCEVGEGLFFAGMDHAAIEIIPSYSEDLLITTNPEQLNQMGVGDGSS